MHKLFAASILALALVVPTLTHAAAGPMQRYSPYGKVFNAVALDAASSTVAINLDQPEQHGIYGLMNFWVCITDASNSVTALTLAVTASRDNGTTDYSLQDCTTATGTCTSSNATWVKNPSAITSPKCWVWRVDVEGFSQLELSITDTGGDASDLMTAYVTFATKG